MKRNSFVFYLSFAEVLEDIPEDQHSEFLKMIINFGLYGIEPNGPPSMSKAMFKLIKPQIEANNKRFLSGQNGGRPPKEKPKHNQKETKVEPKTNQTETKPKPKHNQNETKSKPNVNDNVNVNANENAECRLNNTPETQNPVNLQPAIQVEEVKPESHDEYQQKPTYPGMEPEPIQTVKEVRAFYDKRMQIQKDALCMGLYFKSKAQRDEILPKLQDEFDNWVMQKHTHIALTNYVDWFSRWIKKPHATKLLTDLKNPQTDEQKRLAFFGVS